MGYRYTMLRSSLESHQKKSIDDPAELESVNEARYSLHGYQLYNLLVVLVPLINYSSSKTISLIGIGGHR
jgi:hypothetical protein